MFRFEVSFGEKNLTKDLNGGEKQERKTVVWESNVTERVNGKEKCKEREKVGGGEVVCMGGVRAKSW